MPLVNWRKFSVSACIYILRCGLVIAVLQVLSCSNFQSDTLANDQSPEKDEMQPMSQNAKYLKGFNKLYLKISNETDRGQLDAHQDEADRWRMNWELDAGDVNLALAGELGFILEDQANRKQEQLRNKPGRQPAVDWIQELGDHEKRLTSELNALQLLKPGKPDIDESIALISSSMDLSVRVITEDQDQIQKQIRDGFITLNSEQEALLKSSSELSEKARDWLRIHGSD